MIHYHDYDPEYDVIPDEPCESCKEFCHYIDKRDCELWSEWYYVQVKWYDDMEYKE